jgi:hypothetical protein
MERFSAACAQEQEHPFTVKSIPRGLARIRQLFPRPPQTASAFGEHINENSPLHKGHRDGQHGQRVWPSSSHPPASKNVANWQTHFFSEHNSTRDRGLRMKLSLPTVANSLANWQTHYCR